MKEAVALLDILDRWETKGKKTLPIEVTDAMGLLRIALELESDECVIVRSNGLEVVYDAIDPSSTSDEFEGNMPLAIRQEGILRALRLILEVKELEPILTAACARMRELHRLRTSNRTYPLEA
jgi:hypothetical protein